MRKCVSNMEHNAYGPSQRFVATLSTTYLYTSIVMLKIFFTSVNTQESGNNECLWEAVNPEIPVQHTSLKFQVNQDNIPADGKSL